MVTDGSLQVRCLSASLLGRFTNVSERFLLQTLDKKLMSHLRYVKSDHDRARELHTQGSWDTGQRWGGGPTKMNLDPSEVQLNNLRQLTYMYMYMYNVYMYNCTCIVFFDSYLPTIQY